MYNEVYDVHAGRSRTAATIGVAFIIHYTLKITLYIKPLSIIPHVPSVPLLLRTFPDFVDLLVCYARGGGRYAPW